MTRTELDLRTVLMDRAGAAPANPVRATEVRARIALARRRRARRVVAGSAAALALVATGVVVAPHLGHGTPTDRGTPVAAHHGGSTTEAYGSDPVIVRNQPGEMPSHAWRGKLIGDTTLIISKAGDTQAISTFTPTSWDLVVSFVCEPALPAGQHAQVLINGRPIMWGACGNVPGSGASAPQGSDTEKASYWIERFGAKLGQPSTLGVLVVDENGEPVANPPLGTTVSAGIYASTTIPPPGP